MAPEVRRQAIVDAVLPLLLEHGRAVTTKQIAERAEIAEGTIFRVFATKDELVDAALAQAFAPGRLLAAIEEIDCDQPLEDRLLEYVTILQGRFREIFALLRAVGLSAPPPHLDASDDRDSWRARGNQLTERLLEPDADRLRVPPAQMVRFLRLITFAGSHEDITDHRLMSPEEIVDLVLHGTLRPEPEEKP
jgi:AcrR family transcriptional regulator